MSNCNCDSSETQLCTIYEALFLCNSYKHCNIRLAEQSSVLHKKNTNYDTNRYVEGETPECATGNEAMQFYQGRAQFSASSPPHTYNTVHVFVSRHMQLNISFTTSFLCTVPMTRLLVPGAELPVTNSLKYST